MRFREGASIQPIGFTKTTAGWIVVCYAVHDDGYDVLAGAFETVPDAIAAASAILKRELEEAAKRLQGD
jgi:glyoxylate carboligase